MNLTPTRVETLLNTLQSEIMNIPAKRPDDEFAEATWRICYKEGHRDARHAAAELVAAFASKLDGELK